MHVEVDKWSGFCKFLLFLEVIHVYGFVFLTNKGRKYNGSFVYKIYSSIFRFGVRHTNYNGLSHLLFKVVT